MGGSALNKMKGKQFRWKFPLPSSRDFPPHAFFYFAIFSGPPYLCYYIVSQISYSVFLFLLFSQTSQSKEKVCRDPKVMRTAFKDTDVC